MAEASSSAAGEENSEDEEVSDEASPTLGGPVSPIGRSSNKKKLRYVRDYLLRVPKHQRRRIQKEIDNGYKAG